MKISDILKENRSWHDPDTDYSVSSFGYDDLPDTGAGENTPDGTEKTSDKNAKDSRTRTLLPTHINVDEGDTVSLVHDGQTLRTSTWKELKDWLSKNWDNLQGTYFVSQDGQVLHRFRIGGSST